MLKGLLAALMVSLALPVQAADQTYKIYLGGIDLGWFRYSGTPTNARISSLFDNTPLGVFDGGYEGQSRLQSGRVTYRSKSVSSNKNREVEIVQAKKGRVSEVAISPAKDLTEYSTPAAIPDGVLDPVMGFGQFLSLKNGCPAAFLLYDGRRVVQVTPKSAQTAEGVTTCVLDYRVVLGKGHLSPLYIKNITVTVTFDPSVAKTGPSLLSLRAGLFGLEFRRD
jgi:hypothetical protein